MLAKLLALHLIVPICLAPVVVVTIAADHVAVLRAQAASRAAEKGSTNRKPTPAKSMRVGPCF